LTAAYSATSVEYGADRLRPLPQRLAMAKKKTTSQDRTRQAKPGHGAAEADPVDRFTNREIVTLAVYLLGGRVSPVDTEDVAVKANELAPGRFNWRKYPDQINIELVRVRLSGAKNPEYGGYLLGSGSEGWVLTDAGVAFVEENLRRFESAALATTRIGRTPKKWLESERSRMLASEAFGKIRDRRPEEVTDREAAAFFRIDDYVVGPARDRKVTRIVNVFRNDPELGEAVIELARRVACGDAQ